MTTYVIAPIDYAVGFTQRGRHTHAGAPQNTGEALCGQWFDLAWSRQIDRDNLPVTCGHCLRALATASAPESSPPAAPAARDDASTQHGRRSGA